MITRSSGEMPGTRCSDMPDGGSFVSARSPVTGGRVTVCDFPAGFRAEESPVMTAVAERTGSAIRPFHVDVPEEALTDLRRRLAATRWPSRELVTDRSQGVQLATMQELTRYWATDYDWRACEARLNALPQFTTEIDGVDIHFIHVRSPHPDALPLIMTHGWPGSVIELLETVGPLTDPTAHGGRAEDAFHLVLPSLPGYGFSGEPTELGWESGRIAPAWAELMGRLGYPRDVAQGGDVGAAVTDAMGRQAPEGLLGIHINLLIASIGLGDQLPAGSEQERAAHDAVNTFTTSGFGYFLEQSTRPQTVGYSLLDSPVGLAAWLFDHDTDSYYKISRAFINGEPVGNLTRDNIVDNITLYWLTGTGAPPARWYWETGRPQAAARAAGEAPPEVRVPVGFTTFPGEIFAAPRSWVEAVYPDNLTYFNEVDRAATSPPGRSRNSSPPRCGPRSARCAHRRSLSRAADHRPAASGTRPVPQAAFRAKVASRGISSPGQHSAPPGGPGGALCCAGRSRSSAGSGGAGPALHGLLGLLGLALHVLGGGPALRLGRLGGVLSSGPDLLHRLLGSRLQLVTDLLCGLLGRLEERVLLLAD